MNITRLFTLLLFSLTSVYANVYYSKVEPYEVRKISSNVMGVVIEVKEEMLGKKLSHSPYLVIDSELDEKELTYLKDKLAYLKNTLNVNEKMILNLEQSLLRKRINYERVKNLKIKSSVEKDREFYDLINSENTYLAKEKEINNLKVQIADFELREAQLQRSIIDKNLKAEGFVLYSLDVKVGQVVNKSTPLATVVDTSRAILTIYLDDSDIENAVGSVIYIDNKKTTYKVDRLLNIADSQNISKYKAQIIIEAPKVFSKLVKIELKKSSDAK